MRDFDSAWVLGVVAALAAPGCKAIECGANTLEKDGECVANVQTPGFQCGAGTYFDQASGVCMNTLYGDGGGICGDGTVLVVDQQGNHFCEGTGASSCERDLPCPTPTGENVALCGKLFDLEDSGLLADDLDTTKLQLKVFDPIAFATAPDATPPIKTATPDACGRFAIGEITPPNVQFIAISVDDGVGADNLLVHTGIATINQRGSARGGLRLFAMRRATAASWTTALALPTPLETQGAYVPIFLTPMSKGGTPTPPFPTAQPAAGVGVTIGIAPDNDPLTTGVFYFNDTVATTRATPVTGRTTTGSNGAALVIMQPALEPFGGAGAEPSGCTWPENLAATPPGTIYVQEKLPGPDQGCP